MDPTVLFFLFLLSHSLPILSNAADTLKQGQFIRDGQTIVSSGETFALGFFSPVNSSLRYVGIWYNKISVHTVVWVANRESPISSSSGVLIVSNDGNLEVLDGNWNPSWSTNMSSPSYNSTVVLMDTGNLLLYGGEVGDPDTGLWQSFDYPTDTFLPGMRAGLVTGNGETRQYTSWKSNDDPSKGNFTMGVDPDGLAQVVVWENSRRHWRSGIWDGQVFIGIPEMKVRYLYGFKLSDQGGKMYFTYTVFNNSDIVRFQIRWDGVVDELRWDEEKKEWNNFWIQPTNECQNYNHCGPFASCSMSNSPICTCLKGYEPKFMEEWRSQNWSSGCTIKTGLQCEKLAEGVKVKGDRFSELDGLKLPDHSLWKTDYSKKQCEEDCLGNCSCKAYAHVSGIGCLSWGQDLVDIQRFQQGGNKLYIRLANSDGGRKKSVLILIIVLCTIMGTTILSTSAYLLSRRKTNSKDFIKSGRTDRIALDGNKSREVWTDFTEQHKIKANEENIPELPLVSFESMVVATNDFAEANKLGEGGFGPVYKGIVPCGKIVAIKRLSKKSGQGIEEFKNEVVLIAKLQHRNLVRLLGCCIHGEEKILMYEYLQNKSLDAFIFDSTMKLELDWKKRFNIIEGIARGLLYLHRDSRLTVIHRDLKASNILLDEEMNPKISDFGMAKIFEGNEHQENTTRLVGTYGYMAPEYAMEGIFSVKSDVYSFGVLLLEIISGRKNTQYNYPENTVNLLGYVWKLWTEERAMEFVDPCIRESCSESDVLRCMQVGLLCLQDLAVDRPTMSTVVLMLGNETTVLPAPTRPTLTKKRSPTMSDLSIDSSEITSRNDLTVSMIIGR